MRKILAIMLCAAMLFALPVVAYAEEIAPDVEVEDQAPPVEDGEADDVVPENPAPDDEVYEKPEAQIQAEITTEKIVQYVQAHLEEISVIITMILTVFYQVKKHSALNKSIGTLNNNAVTVAENSSAAISNAVSGMEGVSSVVGGYKAEMERLLAEVRANEEEKRKLANTLSEVNTYLQSSKLANVEFANELAELLVLANIPNAKKEELYSRHRAAVDAIAAAEKTEVKEDVREEA